MMEEKDVKTPNLPNQHPFTVPDGYFEKLPNRLMERTAYAVPGRGATSPAFWLRHYKMALAGVSMVLVFLAAFILPQLIENKMAGTAFSLAHVSNQDIHQYLVNKADLETNEVAEVQAVTPPQALEFIEVSHEDVPVDAAMEVLQDESLPQSAY